MLSHSAVSDCVPWTVTHQVPLSRGILQARILEWVACPPPGDLLHPGIEARFPALQEVSLPAELLRALAWKIHLTPMFS